MYFFLFISKQFAELVHHILLMFHKGVGVAVESDGRILMTEDFGKSFYVHSALDGAGRKGVAQRVEALVGNMQPF